MSTKKQFSKLAEITSAKQRIINKLAKRAQEEGPEEDSEEKAPTEKSKAGMVTAIVAALKSNAQASE